jgi:NAD-dependent SIR2 family protein deacetylase
VTIRLRYCPSCDAWRPVVVVFGETKPLTWGVVAEWCQGCLLFLPPHKHRPL